MNRLIQMAVVIVDSSDLTEVGGDVYAFGSKPLLTESTCDDAHDGLAR